MRKMITELTQLVGEEISGVGFVRDYVELYFDGPILRSMVPILVLGAGGTFRFPESGSRDALCALIGRTVRRVELEENKQLSIETDDHYQLQIPLYDQGPEYPETMHFVPELNQPVQVWSVK